MCTPLLPKMHTPQPFVKRCYGRKRKRLRSDRFRSTAEPYIVKKYRKSLVNQGLCKKKLDTNQDTHCIKIGVQLWRSRRDLNPRYPFGVHTISSRARYDHFDTAPYSVVLHQTAHIYYYEPVDLSIAFFTFFAFSFRSPKMRFSGERGLFNLCPWNPYRQKAHY